MNRMLWSGGLALAGLMMLGAAGAGCGSSTPAPTTGAGGGPDSVSPAGTVAEEDDATSAELKAHHRHHHHGGFAMFILMAADTVGVTPEQQAAVDKIKGDLHAKMGPAHDAEKALLLTLADGVAAGNIDTAKVDAAVAQVTAVAGQVHAATGEAVNQLHAVLRAEQRAALVDKVEAHWAVWQKANAEEPGPTYPNDGHVATLALKLGLSATQVDTIRAGLGDRAKPLPRLDPQEIATHLRAFGDAFRGDTFDAKALATASTANEHMVGWGAAHMARFVETISPVLTPDQRAKFAQSLREHATHNPSAQGNP